MGPQLLTDFTQDLTVCLAGNNILPDDLTSCIMERPNYAKWHNCLLGELTPEEMSVSANLAQMWTNFATDGKPGLGAVPWKSKEPKYLKITDKLEVVADYRKEYHIASNQANPPSPSPTSPSSSLTSEKSTDTTESSSMTSDKSTDTTTTTTTTMTPTTSGASSYLSEITFFVGLLIFCQILA